MRRYRVVLTSTLLAAGPLAAQDNPFSLTGGSVKSAYIVYDMTSKAGQGQGSTFEIGVAPDRWIMRTVAAVEIGGKTDTVRALTVAVKDSQYSYSAMGSKPGDGGVSPTLRPHLAREYAALNAGQKARFKENVKLAVRASGSSGDADGFITLMGDKAGTETIGGHKCEVYKLESITACVLPQAPMVMLRWSNQKEGVTMVAKKVTLNGPIPPAASVFPKGVAWKKSPSPEDADFITNIWAFKKQADPTGVPAATVAQFAVRYLASAEAAPELRAMQGDPSEGSEDNPADEGEDDGGGN